MPLLIEDESTARLVTELAGQRGISTQDAVRLAVQAELDRAAWMTLATTDAAVGASSLRERFATLRKAHPLPPATGDAADKAFFDELSGDL